MTDDQSYRSIEKMPYVSGRGDWARFDNAFFNNPLCCPSRATILTGQYSHHIGVEDNDSGARLDDRSTIATGWTTVATGPASSAST